MATNQTVIDKDDFPTMSPLQMKTPWGTTLTPITKTKIIGSNYKVLPEDYGPFKTNPLTQDKLHPLSQFRDKTVKQDPTEYTDRFRGNIDRYGPKPNGIPDKRSKEVKFLEKEPEPEHHRASFSPFNSQSVLPPITYRHPGSPDYGPPPPGPEVSRPRLVSPPPPVHTHAASSRPHMVSLGELLSLLPPNESLPSDPLLLSREQEVALMSEVRSEIGSGVDSARLKQIYLAMAEYDNNLSGYIAFPDLAFVAHKHQLFLSPKVLRLVASLFVSRSMRAYVNYEKVLSFLGAAIKMTPLNLGETRCQHNQLIHLGPTFSQPPFDPYATTTPPLSPRSFDEPKAKPVYYVDGRLNQLDLKDDLIPSYPTERDDPKLLRILEEQFRFSSPINFETLRMAFQRSDRLHRGSLSEKQIKDLCYDYRLPIQESVLEKVIRRCQHRGGGQYDWQQFITYLERVQPLRTGLDISPSKKPSEFVRHYPNPTASWPHAEGTHPQIQPQPSAIPADYNNPPIHYEPPVYKESMEDMRNDNYQRREERYEDYPRREEQRYEEYPRREERYEEYPRREEQRYEEYPRRDERGETYPSHDDRKEETYGGYHESHQPEMEHEQQQNSQQNGDQPLEEYKYNKTTSGDPPIPARLPAPPFNIVEKMPWFSRFMKMADAFYRHDIECRGHLGDNEVKWLTGEYNRNWQLELSRDEVEVALKSSQKRNGRIDINAYLKQMAVRP